MSFKKVIFFSDGAAAHYKNRKTFSSLCQFKSNFDIEAECHFFATSHGKGPCDAVGGTIKRMALRVSLAKENGQSIKTAKELFDFANQQTHKEINKIKFCYVSNQEYETRVEELQELYSKAKTIPGTQAFHSFQPISRERIGARRYSSCAEPPKMFEMFKK